MIDHVSVPVADLEASKAFYIRVLAPLKMTLLVEREDTLGFGKTYPEFWLNARPGLAPAIANSGHHVGLRARSREDVLAFHSEALAAGGKDAGEPGDRKAAMTVYFGAFIFDLDGNKVEAMTFPPKT
ncbi:MAG: VOC family protein [Kiloniellales bacterium]